MSIFKRMGLVALSFGLLSCGKIEASTTAPSPAVATATPQQKSSESSKSSELPATSVSAAPAISAESVYAEFDRLDKKACKKQEKIVGNTRYIYCTFTDSQGVVRPVLASSSLASEGDGADYLLNEKGDIYAIRYLHSGEIVVLIPDGTNTIVELLGNRDIKTTVDRNRWNQLELTARDAIVGIAEQFDKPAAQASDDREKVEQVALKYMNHQSPGASVKPVIQKVAIVGDTALLTWQQGEAGGMTLLQKLGNDWGVLESGGGAMGLMQLSDNNVPHETAKALLTQIDPNWNKAR
jgi:hypothetical protein